MKKNTKLIKPKYFVLDVDGVFTDGTYYYTTEGKIMKKFGPEDHDGLTLLNDRLQIHTISGDKRGFPITKKRMDDMKLPIDMVSTFQRIEWIRARFNPQETIYMGDGIFDPLVFREVAYGIAPSNAFYKTKEHADFITNARGGEGAVAEACIHILEVFFEVKYDIFSLDLKKGSGIWKASSK